MDGRGVCSRQANLFGEQTRSKATPESSSQAAAGRQKGAGPFEAGFDWVMTRPDGTEEGNVVGKFMESRGHQLARLVRRTARVIPQGGMSLLFVYSLRLPTSVRTALKHTPAVGELLRRLQGQ